MLPTLANLQAGIALPQCNCQLDLNEVVLLPSVGEMFSVCKVMRTQLDKFFLFVTPNWTANIGKLIRCWKLHANESVFSAMRIGGLCDILRRTGMKTQLDKLILVVIPNWTANIGDLIRCWNLHANESVSTAMQIGDLCDALRRTDAPYLCSVCEEDQRLVRCENYTGDLGFLLIH